MSTKPKRPTWIFRVGIAHARLFGAAAIGIAVALILSVSNLSVVTRILVGWDAAVAIYLVATFAMMAGSDVAAIKRTAAAQDEGGFAILILAVAAAVASLGAIFAELGLLNPSDAYHGLYIALAIATVMLSWTFIHTIFALHYAHEYYRGHPHKNGLKFPDDDQPDYWDFVYFAFVIGMTFQVSDVAVSDKSIRRMVVTHGALSFFFSTAIVALTVNIAAGLFQK